MKCKLLQKALKRWKKNGLIQEQEETKMLKKKNVKEAKKRITENKKINWRKRQEI